MTTGSLTAGLSLADTDAAIAALETDVGVLQASVTILDDNIRGVVFVDMGNDDYIMTDAEANSAFIVVSSVGNGTKTLYWPTTSDDTRAAMQSLVTLFAGAPFAIAAQSGGATATAVPNTVHLVSVPDGLGAFNLDEYIQIEARSQNNGMQTLSAGDTVFNDANGGKLLIAADGSAQTLTISAGNYTTNLTANVYCSGAGGLTIQGDMGVTVTGNTVLTTGQSCTIYRDALTETYLCV